MDNSHISIKDIARVAEVSHSTVSRALHDNPLISAATRARVQRLAAEMGYIPDAIARSLQTQRTGTIGLAVTSIADPFFSEIVAGIDEVASAQQLSVFVTSSHNDPEREIEVVETFHRQRVDGIIVAASKLGNRYAERLQRIRVPVVLINNHAAEKHDFIYSVSVDNQAGAKLAVQRLLDLGHRRIGYVGLGHQLLSNQHRLEGYQEALAAAGITPAPAWVAVAPPGLTGERDDVEMGRQYFPHVWEAGVSALFCYNDRVAVGALMACHEAGIAVPAECSVVGFDDINLAQYVFPSLTTVHQPRRKMGRLAMQMILELQAGEPCENQTLLPHLVVRESDRARE